MRERDRQNIQHDVWYLRLKERERCDGQYQQEIFELKTLYGDAP